VYRSRQIQGRPASATVVVLSVRRLSGVLRRRDGAAASRSNGLQNAQMRSRLNQHRIDVTGEPNWIPGNPANGPKPEESAGSCNSSTRRIVSASCWTTSARHRKPRHSPRALWHGLHAGRHRLRRRRDAHAFYGLGFGRHCQCLDRNGRLLSSHNPARFIAITVRSGVMANRNQGNRKHRHRTNGSRSQPNRLRVAAGPCHHDLRSTSAASCFWRSSRSNPAQNSGGGRSVRFMWSKSSTVTRDGYGIGGRHDQLTKIGLKFSLQQLFGIMQARSHRPH